MSTSSSGTECFSLANHNEAGKGFCGGVEKVRVSALAGPAFLSREWETMVADTPFLVREKQ